MPTSETLSKIESRYGGDKAGPKCVLFVFAFSRTLGHHPPGWTPGEEAMTSSWHSFQFYRLCNKLYEWQTRVDLQPGLVHIWKKSHDLTKSNTSPQQEKTGPGGSSTVQLIGVKLRYTEQNKKEEKRTVSFAQCLYARQ